jgi:serine/threonine protein kinase
MFLVTSAEETAMSHIPPGPRRVPSTTPIRNRGGEALYLGRHKVLGLLASGGMGGVYLAEEVTGKRVALKILDPKFAGRVEVAERLAAERDVSRRVGHRGLVDISECVSHPGQLPYLVMELVDGENLAAIQERGSFEIGAIAAIGAQVADAVAAMHAAGIAHCDLKPDNVMILYADGLAGWPQIKLCDFGVARDLDAPFDGETIAGTPSYMAPEQWRGAILDRTDVYALGCTLYELLVGNPPFTGMLTELATKHAEAIPAPPSLERRDTPPALERLVLRMLSKNPALRPKMSEVAVELGLLAYAFPPGADTSVLAYVA